MNIKKSDLFDIKSNINVKYRKIFEKINELDEEFKSSNKVVSIIFKSDVLFVEPLFFILLISKQKKYKKLLVIDIKDIGEQQQKYIHRLLLHFYDMKDFALVKEPENNKTYDERINFYEKLIPSKSRDTIIYNVSDGRIRKNIEIFVYSTEEIKNDTKAFTESMVPIIRMSNVDSFAYEVTLSDTRSSEYELLNIDKSDKELIEIGIKKAFTKWKLVTDFINPVTLIVNEIIDNIKEHTVINKKISNAYISFHKDLSSEDKKKHSYEFSISDDFSGGFLNRYTDVLKNEVSYLNKILSGKNKSIEILDEYSNEIELLEADIFENDKEVISRLFNVDKVYTTHQIPRFMVHFGIPSLLSVLSELKGTLTVFLHRASEKGDRYYQLIFNNTKLVDIIEKNYGMYGTYIKVSFPLNNDFKEKSKYDRNNTAINASLKNSEYKEIFNSSISSTAIQDQISEFKFLNFKNPQNIKKEPIIINFKDNETDVSVSSFIRKVYMYTFQNSIQDVLIINFPYKQYFNYLNTLAAIMYKNEHIEYKGTTLNILFMDYTSMNLVFIGGGNKKEFCYINNELSKRYGVEKFSLLSNVCTESSSNNENLSKLSKLFYKNSSNNKYSLLPFELFDINSSFEKNNLFSELLKNRLEDSKEIIHVDTLQGYHINNFYKFKAIFEDSQWINRIAYKLAEKVSKEYGNNYLFIGMDKYSSLVISIALSFLGKEKDKYFVLYDDKNFKSLEEFCRKNIKKDFILYSPVSFSGIHMEKIERKIDDIEKNKDNIYKYSTIKVKIDNENKNNSDFLLEIKIEDKKDFEKVSKTEFCDKCTKVQEPLYRLDEKNYFSIEDFYLDDYRPKNKFINKYSVRWADSIHFGHVERGTNHYAYYTKTVSFLKNNKGNIEKFLLKVGQDIAKSKKKYKNIVVFAPIHNSNNKFLTLVDRLVFNNDAKIFQFDVSKAEQNFYFLNEINFNYKEDLIVFVDDEVSSSGTLRYFYTLLREKYSKARFHQIITMIDRTSAQDEKMISNYVYCENIDNMESFFHRFTTLEIKPIKTEFENCFLCDRQKEYIDLLDKTVLDMNRCEISKRIVKLNIEDFHTIDSEQDTDGLTSIRNFIKMSAVDFVYKEISTSVDNIIEDYYKNEKKFINSMFDKMKELYKIDDKTHKGYYKFIYDIANFESKIALIKALSFPKIVYYKSIREFVTKLLISQIKDYINVSIDEVLSNIFNLDFLEANKTSKTIEYYENKKKLDYLNFLYITASYLKINYVINKKSIKFYYEISKNLQNREEEHSLLHAYPFAVKMLVTHSKENAGYFENQFNQIIKEFKNNKNDTLLNALYLENNHTINREKFNNDLDVIIKNDRMSLNDKISEFSSKLVKLVHETISTSDEIKIEHILINEKFDLNYNDYKTYLNETVLRDISKDFEEKKFDLNKMDNIHVLYRGATTYKETNEIKLVALPNDKKNMIDITWSNMFDIPFENSNKQCTIVRLVRINEKELQNDKIDKDSVKVNQGFWLRPIGCIVLSHENNYDTHLRCSKVVLSVQNEIIDFISKEFSIDTFNEARKKKDLEDYLSKYNHNISTLLDIHQIIENDILDGFNIEDGELKKAIINVHKYTYALPKIANMAQLSQFTPNSDNKANFFKILKNKKEKIENFLNIANKVQPSTNIKDGYNYKINISNDKDLIINGIDMVDLEAVLVEVCFNAGKYHNLPSGEDCIITFLYQNDVLTISNHMRKREDTSDSKIGLESLKKLFDSLKYKVNVDSEDNIFKITIRKNV